jgi:hypothetical protein
MNAGRAALKKMKQPIDEKELIKECEEVRREYERLNVTNHPEYKKICEQIERLNARSRR